MAEATQIHPDKVRAYRVIKTELLAAKNPEEKRVKARCCIERARLVALALAINQFLESTVSSSETLSR